MANVSVEYRRNKRKLTLCFLVLLDLAMRNRRIMRGSLQIQASVRRQAAMLRAKVKMISLVVSGAVFRAVAYAGTTEPKSL